VTLDYDEGTETGVGLRLFLSQDSLDLNPPTDGTITLSVIPEPHTLGLLSRPAHCSHCAAGMAAAEPATGGLVRKGSTDPATTEPGRPDSEDAQQVFLTRKGATGHVRGWEKRRRVCRPLDHPLLIIGSLDIDHGAGA